MEAPKTAKSVFNSLLSEVSASHGSFGRFYRVLHETASDEKPGPRTPSSGDNSNLFPSVLVVPRNHGTSRSARIRARRRGRETSWEWVELVWSLFTFLEGGSPYKPCDQLALANLARACMWTQQHAQFAGCLHQQIREFVFLRSQEPLSRGHQKLNEFIDKIRPHNSDYKPGPYTLSELSQSALPVKPDRMSLPEKAGVLDPRDHLKGKHLRAFERMHWEIPHDVPPEPPTKGCFKVDPNDIPMVYRKLLESGVATLIPAEMALRNAQGQIVSGGLFAVPHKEATDRIILDRRPMNELERRMIMAKLPHGSLFTQLIIPKGCSIRASGDDLSNYFYLLKHHEEWLGRNTVGNPIPGHWFPDFGCSPEKDYMLSFRVIAMGDSNAVDIAQETHYQILRDAGCLRGDETIAFKCILPAKATWEGLYIDDHVATQIVPKRASRQRGEKFRDDEIIRDSRARYDELGLPVSQKKRYTKIPKFTAWGTEVDSQTGRVGAPLHKLQQLVQLIHEVCQLPFVTKKLLQKTVGLIVHPAMHRRIFMSLLQETYLWIEKLGNGQRKKLPTRVSEELYWVALCVPLMHANARWPISRRVSATDASSSGGGRAATMTSSSVAQTLFRFSEHHGEACRLDWASGSLAPPSQMQQAPAELERLMAAHIWNTTQKCKFGHRQHINILELKMLKAELKDLVKNHTAPQRSVVLCDSRVVCGAFAKGRSSSRQLNRILRSMIGWLVAGQKSLHLVWVQSCANPSDHPSRGRPIPEPKDIDPLVQSLLGNEFYESRKRRSNREIHKLSVAEAPQDVVNDMGIHGNKPDEHPAQKLWTFKEIFAGRGQLTGEFRRNKKSLVGSPIEINQRGKKSKFHDLLHDRTFDRLCTLAKQPRQFWHFGLPCGSFSIMQNMNQGSRSQEKPEGNGLLERELLGNELLSRTVYLCRLLHSHGSFFIIENPQSSYAWKMPSMISLLKDTHAQTVVLDQCEYGLKIPDKSGELALAKKGTIFAGTLPKLERLSKRCSKNHAHAQVIGTAKAHGKWQKRSALAGAYPTNLCRAYHRCCTSLFAL